MITIIHGDDTAASRTYLLQKKGDMPVVTYTAETVSLTSLIQEIEGGGLFETDKVIIIESLFSQKSSKTLDEILEYIGKQKNADILLWESKTLTKKALSQIPRAEIKEFALPKVLFQFLDALLPGNGKEAIVLFHDLLKTTPVELIFFMVIRQYRLLLWFAETSESAPIDEAVRLSPWQKKKILSMSRQYSVKKLIAIYSTLSNIDVLAKTGGLVLPLQKTIDMFLLEL